MTIVTTKPFLEQAHVVSAYGPDVPSSANPPYVDLRGYTKIGILIASANTTTVTPSAVSLKQAQDLAGTGEKAVTFTSRYHVLDSDTVERFVTAAVTANTFNLSATESKRSLTLIEIERTALDQAGGFDCIALDLGNAVAQTVTALYLLWPARYQEAGAWPLVPALT